MWPQALPQARAPRPLALGQAGPAVQAWRHFTVVAPAGAVGVGDPLAAERLALLRCRPRLLAVPVRVQQFVLASFWRRAGPLRPTQWEGGRGGGGCLSIGAGRAESGSRRLYTRKGDGGLGLAVGDGA